MSVRNCDFFYARKNIHDKKKIQSRVRFLNACCFFPLWLSKDLEVINKNGPVFTLYMQCKCIAESALVVFPKPLFFYYYFNKTTGLKSLSLQTLVSDELLREIKSKKPT